MRKEDHTQKKAYLFITDTDYGSAKLTGAHKRFLELVKSVSKRNKVILISREIPELDNCEIERIIIKSKKRGLLPSHIRRIIEISQVLRKIKKAIKYDYAISFGPADTVCYGINGYKNIITLFREDFLGYRESIGTDRIKMLYFKKMEKYAVKHSDRIIVQCEDDKKALLKRYGGIIDGLSRNIFVQVNNVNASWMKKGNAKKIKNNSIINIVFIGNFSDKRKGHHLLLPAVGRLIDDGYHNLRLYIAGDGSQLDEYKHLYNKYEEMIFMGRVNDVGELLSIADLEVVPSLMDSCPNTVLEGLNNGIAVYGSNIGGIKEILREKKYLFEPNIDAIYAFMKKIIDKKRFVNDAIDQKYIKDRLTFDWGNAIIKIIEEDGQPYLETSKGGYA